MKSFTDQQAETWVASAREERTPRHHGRWYLIFHPEGQDAPVLPMPEVRWQNRETAERTIRTMSAGELRRRLNIVKLRAGLPSRIPAGRTMSETHVDHSPASP
jgi:hypothetical protein